MFKRRAAGGLIQLDVYETFEEALNAIQQRAPERREGRDAEYYLPYSDDQGAGKDYKWNEANFSALMRFVYSQAEQGRQNVVDGIWEALDLPSEENDKGLDAEVDIAKLKEVPYPEGDAFRALLAPSAFLHAGAAAAERCGDCVPPRPHAVHATASLCSRFVCHLPLASADSASPPWPLQAASPTPSTATART